MLITANTNQIPVPNHISNSSLLLTTPQVSRFSATSRRFMATPKVQNIIATSINSAPIQMIVVPFLSFGGTRWTKMYATSEEVNTTKRIGATTNQILSPTNIKFSWNGLPNFVPSIKLTRLMRNCSCDILEVTKRPP